ncbi:TPA: bifunctional oligoribonuclease/PAP phosphatase NrnA [Candidatus Bipolaricaulota bacterium]|nr:bifunctional oligoribonuclease/PAP phosphatase NrnA [Candidatus Bipolaricaulota bacterium]
MKASLDRVVERLKAARRALVIGHVRPDGDAIGSVAALTLILRWLGKEAEGCIPDPVPWFYREIPGTRVLRSVEELRGREFDTTVVVDTSSLSRIGTAAELLSGQEPDVVIDHHVTNTGFGALNFCDPSYAAVALIVHEIGKRLVEYDRELAELLLLGLATDTGFFKYGNVDAQVFEAAAELTRQGASIQPIASAVLEHRTPNTMRLLVEMLSTLQLEAGGQLAYAYVSADMLRRTGCSEEDTEGFVGELRAIHGVEVAVLFSEWPEGEVHVSLRSKSYADVSRVALAFGGGGHPRAAGCTLKVARLAAAIPPIVAAARRLLEGG